MNTLELIADRAINEELRNKGDLYIDGIYFGTINENLNHHGNIPSGRYHISMNVYSPVFASDKDWMDLTGGYLPTLEKVPWHSGVCIASLKDDQSHSGSIQLGQYKDACPSSYSTKYEMLYNILKRAHEDNKEIWITIK